MQILDKKSASTPLSNRDAFVCFLNKHYKKDLYAIVQVTVIYKSSLLSLSRVLFVSR
jgi:hypothetical protein